MIKRFGSIFAGNVDFDDIGLEGTPVNDRSLSDDHLATVFEKATNMAQLMDRLDYDTFWMAEHHFQPEGYEVIPNLLLFNVHLAHVTEKLKFGCGFNVAPMWHPLRLAEDFAVADHLTKGRVIFGVGRGYHSREVDTFGAPSTITDSDANRELFEEQVDIIFKAFNNRSFSHHGKHYQIPPNVPYRGYNLEEISLVPRPRTLPVECWQPLVTSSQRAMDFMAKHGIKGIIGGGAAVSGASHGVMIRWRDTLAAHGRETELGGDLVITYATFIGDTEEKAMAQARLYFEEYLKMFGPLGFVPLRPEQIEALGDPKRARQAGLPTVENAIADGRYICGTSEQVTDQLLTIQEAYPGLEEINIGPPSGGVPESVFLEQLEWFGKEVMPTFKKQSKAG